MLTHVNWIRGLAAFLIVFVHAEAGFGVGYEVNSYAQHAINIFTVEATCIFIAISGFFFQHNINKYSHLQYFEKKIRNVIVPYIVISIPAILIYVSGMKTSHNWMDMDDFYNWSVAYQVVYLLVTGAQLGPLWFIPVLVLFYLCAPILSILSRSRYFYLLAFLSAFIFLSTSRPFNDSDPLVAFIHFLPIYIFGMIFCKHIAFFRKIKRLLVVACIILSCLAVNYFIFYGLQKLLLFFAIYIYLEDYKSCLEKNISTVLGIFNLLGNYSFAIYFLHGYVMGFYRYLNHEFPQINLIEYFVVRAGLSIFAILFSLGVAYFVNFVTRGRSRILLGA